MENCSGSIATSRSCHLKLTLSFTTFSLQSPVSSLIKGSLLRSLLIQIQKSKVDIELAMSGIDKLLKSQQLLFGAVGIAPAMVILWGIKNGFGRLIWGKYEGSGEEKRMGWEAMR